MEDNYITIEREPALKFEVGIDSLDYAEVSQLLAVFALLFENLANGNAHPSGEISRFDFTIKDLPEKFAPMIETGKIVLKTKSVDGGANVVQAVGFQEDEEGATYCHIKLSDLHPNFWKGEE